MREVIELATDKGVRAFVERAHAAGLTSQVFVPPAVLDASLFDEQGRDLL